MSVNAVTTSICLCLIIAGPGLGATRAQEAEIAVADFESTNYGDWKVTGEAFGPGPAHGTLPGQMPVDGFCGHGLANPYYDGIKLARQPVSELQKLRGKADELGAFSLKPGDANPLTKLSGELLELRTEFKPNADSEVHFSVRGMSISYNAGQLGII